MKSSVDRLDDTTVKLSIDVPFEELQPEFDKAYAAVAKQINIPGFRKGKAPRKLVEARVNREYVLNDVFNEAIPSRLNEALEANKVEMLGTPDIQVTSLPTDDHLAFEATFSERPEIKVPDFKAIKVTVDAIEADEAKVDEAIEHLRERFSTLKDVKRKAKKGDVVTFNLKAEIDGKELPEAAAEGVTHTIGGENEMVPGLDKAVKGLHSDESATFEAELAIADGKTATVTVDVTAVKGRELPKLDDEFVQEASEFDTVDELRASYKERVEDEAKSQQAVALRDAVLDAAFKEAEFTVPTFFVEQQVKAQIDNLVSQFGGEEGLARILEAQGKSLDEYKEEVTKQVTETTRTQLLLDAVAAQDEPEVTEKDVQEHLVFTAQNYGMHPQQLLEQLASTGNLASLYQDVRRGKALAAAICEVTATDSEGNTIDTTEYFGDEDEAADEAEKSEEKAED